MAQTCEEFVINLKLGIITHEMLVQALYSVNKRAKNYRDKEREYWGIARKYYSASSMYTYSGIAEEKKDAYYAMKDKLLTVLKPTCVHVETQYHKKKYYDYEEEFNSIDESEVEYCSQYYDREEGRYVEFIVVYEPVDCYYLFYDLGSHSFHTPISSPDVYPDLELIRIDSLVTHGADYHDLMSPQFIRKMIELIDSGDYEYQAA